MAVVQAGDGEALDWGLGPKRQNVQNRTRSGNHQSEEQVVTKGEAMSSLLARLLLRWGQLRETQIWEPFELEVVVRT